METLKELKKHKQDILTKMEGYASMTMAEYHVLELELICVDHDICMEEYNKLSRSDYVWTLDNIDYTQGLMEFKVLKSRLPNDSGQTISVKEWFEYNYWASLMS